MPGDGRKQVRVFEPADAVELAQVEMALEGSDIPYRIENEHYFQTGGGIYSLGDTRVGVVVPEDRAREAKALLKEWFWGGAD